MASLKHAVTIIKAGGVVAYPTESFWALGADATNKRAVGKIFRIKGRSERKPIALIAGNEQQAKKYFYMTKPERILANRHWPGPLTLVLQPKGPTTPNPSSERRGTLAADALLGTTPPAPKHFGAGTPPLKKRGSKGIGVRVPRHAIAAGLACLVGRPITATSANPSGGRPTKSASRVHAWWPDMPVVAGACGRATKPSTVVVAHDRRLTTVRPGAVKI